MPTPWVGGGQWKAPCSVRVPAKVLFLAMQAALAGPLPVQGGMSLLAPGTNAASCFDSG